MNTTSVHVSSVPSGDQNIKATIGQLSRRPEAGSLLGLIAVFVFFALVGGQAFLSPAGYASWLNVAAWQ
ncbi:hypothetical protein [Sinorhizobium sp. 8-89]|uniref:hypothetical protein n=1 Tax=Sinorhizobium sp. 8-89 TaxID=3049089 RepID=UPI003869CCF3